MPDILIRNVKIIDGISDEPYFGDIAIEEGRIVGVGKISGQAKRVINGDGLTACPGFFDIHSHIDRELTRTPTADNLILQGITSALAGHCGASNAPAFSDAYHPYMEKRIGFAFPWHSFGEMLDEMEKGKLGVNLFQLVGTNMIRSSAMPDGWNRPASEKEIEAMKRLTEEAMSAGAYGVSYTGDAGTPSHWMSFDELTEVLKVCRKYDGVFAPHTRHHQFQFPSGEEGMSIYGLYDGPKGEMFVGRYHGLLEPSEVCFAAGGCRLHISHITPTTIVYHPHSASLDEALALSTLEDIIDAPRQKGLDVTFDVLCSDFSIGAEKRIASDLVSGTLIRPDWMTGMDDDAFASSMKAPDAAERLRKLFDSGNMKVGMLHPVQDPYWFECYRVISSKDKNAEGKTLAELAFGKGRPTVETVYHTIYEVIADLLAADPSSTWALIRDKREYRAMNTFMKHDVATIGTDMGKLVPLAGSHGRPQDDKSLYGQGPYLYNGFIQFLVNAVRRDGVLTLPEAVKRITSFPAQKVLHLNNYGVLRENAFANIVLLDETKLDYRIDFTHPMQAPTGIESVFVNGTPALENGKLTGATAGRLVRHGSCFE